LGAIKLQLTQKVIFHKKIRHSSGNHASIFSSVITYPAFYRPMLTGLVPLNPGNRLSMLHINSRFRDRNLLIGNFHASTRVKYYSAINISMCGRLVYRRRHGFSATEGERQ